jgi:glycosyltransferase involved in cell wall biosynthesis
MMKILIITDSIPFPPYNGKELPIAGIFQEISKRHRVDILVISSKKKTDTEKSSLLPPSIKNISFLTATKLSKKKHLFNFLLSGRHSFSTLRYSYENTKQLFQNKMYDLIWLSPVTNYGFIDFCRKNDILFFKKFAMGLNDSKTHLHRDSIYELIHTRIFKLRYATDWIRSFIIEPEERNYLKKADIIHVQTQAEYNNVKRILRTDTPAKVIVAPNGIKSELLDCSYEGIDSNYILYMTHLDAGRLEESAWFLKKIWPSLHKIIPGARLLIVGKPPQKKIPYITNNETVIIHGYSNNLIDLFNSVRLAVVPTFHGTGLINRILDALIAGVPVVSTPAAIATFPSLKAGEQILSAQTPAAFTKEVAALYNDKDLRLRIANAGREFGKSFPTWQQSAWKIETALQSVL